MYRRSTCLIVALVFVGFFTAAPQCGPPASFTIVGPLPGLDVPPPSGGNTLTAGGSISDDGRDVAGWGLVHKPGTTNPTVYLNVPFRYHAGVRTSRLDDLLGPPTQREVRITGNGRKILIVPYEPPLTRFWTWEGESLTPTDLPPPITIVQSIGDATPNGRVLVGQGEFGTNLGEPRAFRYADGVVMQLLDPNGNRVLYGAAAVSADGNIVAGFTDGDSEGFRLNVADNSITFLGQLTSSPIFASLPTAMTPDGRVIVGISAGYSDQSGVEAQPFRWKSGKVVGLGTLPGGSAFVGYQARGVSADGRIVVGGCVYVRTGFCGDSAFVWDASNGMRRLSDLLEAQGVDLGNWVLESADGISASGDTIVGTARDPQLNYYVFLARLPRTPSESP